MPKTTPKPKTKPGDAEKKNYHHGDLRQTLLDEAAKIIQQGGEASLSMRTLAAKVGVSRSAPYHHFEDKRHLLCAIAEEGFKRFTHEVALEIKADNALMTEQSITEFVNKYVGFAVSNSEYYSLMFSGSLWQSEQLTESLTRESRDSFRNYLSLVQQWVQHRETQNSFDALRYAQVSWSTLHGMSRLLIDGIYVDPVAVNAMCATAAKMFWNELNLHS